MEINLKEISIEEKLRIMELLWDDLCRNKPDFQSPHWHGDILKAREKSLNEGKDKFVDWEQAKKEIWNSIS